MDLVKLVITAKVIADSELFKIMVSIIAIYQLMCWMAIIIRKLIGDYNENV